MIFYRRWNTLQKILRTRWKNAVQTIVCTKNKTQRSYVQTTQRSNWRTFGNHADHRGIQKTLLLPKLRGINSRLYQKLFHMPANETVTTLETHTPLQEVSTLKSYPGDLLQIDILGQFPSSPYKYVLTAIDVFTKYLFALPLTTISALSVATALVSIMFQHSYIPQEILSDLGTQFVSDLFHELNQLLEIKVSHASLKHPQTIGVVEMAHEP